MAITILGAGLIGAWFSLTLYLIALTIVGPKAPRPGSAVETRVAARERCNEYSPGMALLQRLQGSGKPCAARYFRTRISKARG
jgi:hypothetical protein